MQLSADTFQLVTSAAPVCGRTGAQNVAARRAAIETINRGVDKFLMLGAAAENNVRVVGHMPVQPHTIGTDSDRLRKHYHCDWVFNNDLHRRKSYRWRGRDYTK